MHAADAVMPVMIRSVGIVPFHGVGREVVQGLDVDAVLGGNVVVLITILVLHASGIGHHVQNSTPGVNFGICFISIWLKSLLTNFWKH